MSRGCRHTPVRLCSGCGSRDLRTNLDRFTLVDGSLKWDSSAGRGAYLHRLAQCRQSFVSRKPFLRSLRASVGRVERARFLAAS